MPATYDAGRQRATPRSLLVHRPGHDQTVLHTADSARQWAGDSRSAAERRSSIPALGSYFTIGGLWSPALRSMSPVVSTCANAGPITLAGRDLTVYLP